MSKVEYQKLNTVKVMGFGTFDGLHAGHLSYFKQLKALGERLIIVVARDKNVEKIKGRPTHFDEKSRLNKLKSISIIDEVILGNSEDFYQVIRDHKPSIIGLGYDQMANLDRLKKEFPEIEIHRLKSFQPEIYKSSLIKRES